MVKDAPVNMVSQMTKVNTRKNALQSNELKTVCRRIVEKLSMTSKNPHVLTHPTIIQNSLEE